VFLGVKKFEININVFIQKIPKNTMAPMKKIKQFLNGHNFGCV